MSIWADKVMTPSLDNGQDKPTVNRQCEITATTSIRCQSGPPPAQYGLDAIESFPADDFDAKKMPNTESHHHHQYAVRRQIIATAIRDSQSGNGGIKSGALSFIKNLGVFFPRRQQRNNSEATVETCEVLENYNASTDPMPSGKLMPNRSTLLATASSSSSTSSLSGNSSKQLCGGGNSTKDELMLSTKCDKTCDNSVALRGEVVAGDPVNMLVVADVRNVTSLPDMGGSTVEASSFALPRVNLKTR